MCSVQFTVFSACLCFNSSLHVGLLVMTSYWRKTLHTKGGGGKGAEEGKIQEKIQNSKFASENISTSMSEGNDYSNSSDMKQGCYEKRNMENCDTYRSNNGRSDSDSSDKDGSVTLVFSE